MVAMAHVIRIPRIPRASVVWISGVTCRELLELSPQRHGFRLMAALFQPGDPQVRAHILAIGLPSFSPVLRGRHHRDDIFVQAIQV